MHIHTIFRITSTAPFPSPSAPSISSITCINFRQSLLLQATIIKFDMMKKFPSEHRVRQAYQTFRSRVSCDGVHLNYVKNSSFNGCC